MGERLYWRAQHTTKDYTGSFPVHRKRTEEYLYKERGLLYTVHEEPEEEDRRLPYHMILEEFSTNLEIMMQQNRKWMRDFMNLNRNTTSAYIIANGIS